MSSLINLLGDKAQNAVQMASDIYDTLKYQISTSKIGGDTSFTNYFLQSFGSRYASYGSGNIGILVKNKQFTYNNLVKNEYVVPNYDTDNAGPIPVGKVSNPYYNADTEAWYMADTAHNEAKNYISYILQTYFDNNTNSTFIPNFTTKEEQQTNYLDSLKLDGNKVGKVKGYDQGETKSKLGEYGNFYVKNTIENAASENSARSNSISQGVYDAFKFDGDYGIAKDTTSRDSYTDIVKNATSVIAWSTTDHLYSTSMKGNLTNNYDLMASEGKEGTVTTYTDLTRNIVNTTIYDNFSNYYSMTYSHGLYFATNSKTKKFIAKSMYGYDLLDDGITVDLTAEGAEDETNHAEITQARYGVGKKYYAPLGGRGRDYISQIMNASGATFVHKDGDVTKNDIIRINLNDVGNDNVFCATELFTYAEPEAKGTYIAPLTKTGETFNEGATFGYYQTYQATNLHNTHDLIYKTNQDFLHQRYDTLIGRFHTPYNTEMQEDITSTAISTRNGYGMSHGRNLLKKNHKDAKTNGYENPYCRVWTFHHQYAHLTETIRPFSSAGDWENSEFAQSRRLHSDHLKNWGVRSQENGLVRIAPKNGIDDIKKCMFSIENLAWKHELNDTNPSVGPNGGRIMWFPPYDLSFSENVGVNWGQNSFIGRGEKIYTYTDTERGGTLKFKILIDHPSIVDTWRRDKGKGALAGGVDDVDSEEQTLLRFFAGCEILDVKHKDKLKVVVQPSDPVNEPPAETTPLEEPTPPKSVDDSLFFFVFFPNNYSGQNDRWDGEVKPMWYLANGANGNYDENGNGDIPTTLDTKYNGYEMDAQNPIDASSSSSIKCGNGITVGGTIDTQTNEWIPSTARTSSFSKANFTDSTLYKYSCVYQDSKDKKSKNKWWYRVDNVTRGQHMHIPTKGKKVYDPWGIYGTVGNSTSVNGNLLNYCDTVSYGLNNTIGYKRILQLHTEVMEQEEKLYSFADVFCAIEGDKAKACLDDNAYDNSKIDEIKNILDQYKVSKIIYTGYASSQGYLSDNKRLAKQRGLSVKAWLTNTESYKAKFKDATLECGDNAVQGQSTTKSETGGNQMGYDNSELLAKMWRCVKIELKLTQDTVTEVTKENTDADNVEKLDDDYERISRQYIEDMSKLIPEDALNFDSHQLTAGYNNTIINGVAANTEEKQKEEYVNAQKKELEKTQHASAYDGYEYDESVYFEELKRSDPFLHHKITDKIQYFDPAFHSISPEGFNARLTFLHQCTRQGSTMSSSDGLGARNMAFGAPPICVLRIGDFYNTRIIIESLNITYDNNGIQWDLNDEGIGVMPMMADIDISFKFLGGSDLGGPIKRLQNAVSFNYYANTSVYDGNAEYLPDGVVNEVGSERTEEVQDAEEKENVKQ